MTKKKEATLDRLSQAVIWQLLHHGYSATSMRCLAQEANLSQAGIYHYNFSKENLFVQSILHYAHPLVTARAVCNMANIISTKLCDQLLAHSPISEIVWQELTHLYRNIKYFPKDLNEFEKKYDFLREYK